MKKNRSINLLSANVLLRIVIFLVYYIALIVLGILILYGTFLLSAWIIPFIPLHISSVRATIVLVIILAGLWSLAGMLGFYLIKPLFSFQKNENKNRVEVTQKECPELFAIIKELAQQTGCKFPKHIYLSSDVNACVFYNTSFWSIFFPVRKNLEIGLGLFHSTNLDEVKSIIAHEFGHFSQNSMKIGSTVYVSNSVLYNLIYTDDFYERLINKWCLSETSIWAFFGSFTRFLTNGIRRATVSMFKFVQKGYLKLSRQMEYDADTIACQCVGVTPFVSALSKINTTSRRHDIYEHLLFNLFSENKSIKDYWEGYIIADKCLKNVDRIDFNHNTSLQEPACEANTHPSNVEMTNIWSSHPSLKDRLRNAKSTGSDKERSELTPAWSIIPENIRLKISAHRINILSQSTDENKVLIDMEEFHKWTTTQIEMYFIPTDLKPFFDRVIISFEEPKEFDQSKTTTPFTEENGQLLMEYETAVNDWNLLNAIVTKEIEAKEIRYKQQLFSRKRIPIEAHRSYLQQLAEKAALVDEQVYHFLSLNTENRDEIRYAYTSIFYVQKMQASYEKVLIGNSNLIDELNKPVRREKEEFTELILHIRDCEQNLRRFISAFDFELLSVSVAESAIEFLQEYARIEHHYSSSKVDLDIVNEMFEVANVIGEVHNHLKNTAYQVIINQAKKLKGEEKRQLIVKQE